MVYDQIPSQLHYYEPGTTTPKKSAGNLLVGQTYIKLNMLQNSFLIDRVAIARGAPKEQSLLNIAMETMDLTTMFWIKRDQLMMYSSAFDWIVSTQILLTQMINRLTYFQITCYGIPSAGVICVELLKQSIGQSVLQLSRSDAIQKLTMFIGFLEWIRPTDGNYLLAGRLRKVVRRILDRVLDPPKDLMRDGSEMMESSLDPMLAPFGEMDWLNTIDWTQGSWTEFP